MIPFWQYPLLFLAALFAGFVDSIAGGGGLITLPVLLGTGMPPQVVLGTNKLQASFGSGSAALHFYRTGTIQIKECVSGILFTAVGAAVGAFVVQQIHPAFLEQIIPYCLLAIGVYTLCSPRLGNEDRAARMGGGIFHLLVGLTLGFYDGFFGPGVGSFWVIAYLWGLGHNIKKATGYTKVMNFTSNLAALFLFMLGGHLCYWPGLVMAGGQVLGARLGSGLVVTKGARFVRPIFILVVLAITFRLFYSNYHK